jgi:hypothetical protein
MTDKDEDRLNITTISVHSITPEQVEAEAKRFAMRTGGILLMAMAERGITEKQLASMLEVSSKQIRNQLIGEAWRSYLPIAALCLALGIKMDLRTQQN